MLLKVLFNFLNKRTTLTWKYDTAKCNKCGHEWKVLHPVIGSANVDLQCPKCKARDSEVIAE